MGIIGFLALRNGGLHYEFIGMIIITGEERI